MSLFRESGSSPNGDNDSTPAAITADNQSVIIISELTGTIPYQIPPSTAALNPEAAGLPPKPPMISYANIDFTLFEEGYESDGYIPPQLIENEYVDYLVDDEDPIQSGNQNKPSDTATCTPSAEHTPNQGPEEKSTEIYAPVVVAELTSLNEADIPKIMVKIIKEHLKGKGLATTGGRKNVLVD